MSKSVNLSNLPEATDEARAFMAQMRRAALEGVTAADITGIVKSQVKRAKDGDQKAIGFVFDRIVGGYGPEHGTPEEEPEPIPKNGGDYAKRMKAMEDRAAMGLPVAEREGSEDPEGDAVSGRRR